jgi:hypothetical protein
MKKANSRFARTRLIVAAHRSKRTAKKPERSLINQVFTVGPSVLNPKCGIRVIAVGDAEYGEPSFVTTR